MANAAEFLNSWSWGNVVSKIRLLCSLNEEVCGHWRSGQGESQRAPQSRINNYKQTFSLFKSVDSLQPVLQGSCYYEATLQRSHWAKPDVFPDLEIATD